MKHFTKYPKSITASADCKNKFNTEDGLFERVSVSELADLGYDMDPEFQIDDKQRCKDHGCIFDGYAVNRREIDNDASEALAMIVKDGDNYELLHHRDDVFIPRYDDIESTTIVAADSNLKQLTPNMYTKLVMKERLNIRGTTEGAPRPGMAYYLWGMPFTDLKTGELDEEQGELLKQQFLDILDELSDKYGFKYYWVETPLGGNLFRSCWSYVVYGPNVLVKRKTTEVVKILDEI